jgi:eukaryotic translation initiation factor 2C
MFGSPQYHANIALKVNVKLGGANSRVQGPLAMPAHMRAKPFMIMGADVHHPPPADDVSPSIAAVVGSWDPLGTKYNTCVSPQVCLRCLVAAGPSHVRMQFVSFEKSLGN